MQRLIYLGIAVLGGGLALASWLDAGYEITRALEAYRAECHSASARDAEAVERTFRTIYQHARMIARMPGVRAIDRDARNFDENAEGATREIYNNLAADIAVSALYIVPIEQPPVEHPDQHIEARPADPTPIVSFGEPDTTRRGPMAPESDDIATAGWSIERARGRFACWRLIGEQLEWLRDNFPRESSIAGLAYPAIASPEVVAWQRDPDEAERRPYYDRPSVVYSVPFYGTDGELRGCVSAVIRTTQLARLLTADGVRLENHAMGYVVTRPGVEAAARHEEAKSLYTEAIDIGVPDGNGAWKLTASAPDNRFWDRLDVRSAGTMAVWGYWGSGLITMTLGGIAWAVRRERVASGRREQELATKVKERTAHIEATAGQMEVLLLQARAATEAKSGFLANMSHEIRTPMTSIVGYADLLLNPDQTADERAEAVNTIRRNAEHLLAIVNDILDISKIEAGRMTVETIPTRPAQIVEEVYSLMQVRARAKGIELKVQRLTLLPDLITTDPTRLRQILVNLVGNAIKFTEEGTVTLAVEMLPSGLMRFSVTDTGIGMTPEQMGRLFSAFTQADATMSRRFGGTGLGLTISKRLAEMLGGDITVESEAGQGSTFSVTIATGVVEPAPALDRPIADIAAVMLGLDHVAETGTAALAAPSPAPSQADHRSPATAKAPTTACDAATTPQPLLSRRILLAEDGPDNQRLIMHHLKKVGAEVEVAENGQIAMEKALASPFDVVLMDMQMPVMDGYTATSLLRSKGYRGPILALTAHAMAGDREKCLTAGCDDYLTKPIDRARLIAACAEWAEKSARRPVAGPDAPTIPG